MHKGITHTRQKNLNDPQKKYRIGTVSKNGLLEGLKIVSEYAQEIPQSQTADNPVAPRGRATQQSRYTRKTN